VSDEEIAPRRPFGVWIVTLALLASPLLHAAALLLHERWLNFGSPRLWDGFGYFLIAPIVGTLMLRRHERPLLGLRLPVVRDPASGSDRLPRYAATARSE